MKPKLLQMALLMLGVILIAAACGKPSTTTTTQATTKTSTTTAAPVPTGTLTIGLSAFGTQALDPTLNVEPAASSILWPMFDYLIGAKPDGQLSKDAGVARDWSVVTNATNSTYTLTLRQGVKFQDGTELTSADVKFTLQYDMRPASKMGNASALAATIDQITTPDPYTVVITTKKPYATLLNDLSQGDGKGGIVVPAKYITDKGEEYFNSHPMGSGPYKFVEQATGDHITYQAIDGKHWLYGIPKYKTISYKLIPEETTRIANLKTGQVDVIDISREQASTLTDFSIFRKTGTASVQLEFGNTFEAGTYLADSRVREALNLAIDRDQILKYVFQGQGKTTSDVDYGTGALGYQAMPAYSYDPNKAKALLNQAFPNGVSITLMYYADPSIPELQQMDQAVADMWTKVGVNVKMSTVDLTVWRTMLVKGQLTNTVFSQVLTNHHLWTDLWFTVRHSKGAGPLVKDPQLDALVDAARAAPDLDSLGAAQVKVAQFLRQGNYSAPIVEVGPVYAGSQKVKGWNTGSRLNDPDFQDLILQK